jgi:hypothetical protein
VLESSSRSLARKASSIEIELANTFREVSEEILRDIQESMARGDCSELSNNLERFIAFCKKWEPESAFSSLHQFCQLLIDKAGRKEIQLEDQPVLENHVQACVAHLQEMGLIDGGATLPASDVASIELVAIPSHRVD